MLGNASKFFDLLASVGPVIAMSIALLRWLDAVRLSADVDLPVPLAWRVVLARYNLLVVTTFIYRGVQALKRPTRANE